MVAKNPQNMYIWTIVPMTPNSLDQVRDQFADRN